MKKETYDDPVSEGFEAQQAGELDVHMPDVDTKLDQMGSRLDARLDQMESRLIRWMAGIFFTFFSVLSLLLAAANFLLD